MSTATTTARSQFAEVAAEATAQGLDAKSLLEAASRRFPEEPTRIIAAMRSAIKKAAECDNLPEDSSSTPAQPRQLSAAEKAIASALAIMDFLPKKGIKTADGRELAETSRVKGKANLKDVLDSDGPEAERVAASIISDIVALFQAAKNMPAPRYLQKSNIEGVVEVWTAGPEVVKDAAKEMTALSIAFAVAPWVDGIGRTEPKNPRQIRQALQKAKAEIEAERRVKGDGSIQTISLNASPFSQQDGEFCLEGWERSEDMAIGEVPRHWKVWHRQTETVSHSEVFHDLAEQLA